MGTRHLVLVYYNGAYHIAQYGQFDGYPAGSGAQILRFISDPAKVAKLKAVLSNADAMLYTPTEEQCQQLDPEIHPSMSISTGGAILETVANATEPVPIIKEMWFLADQVSCEWVYCVDLDDGVLEVYSGSNGTPVKDQYESRFEGLVDWKEVRKWVDGLHEMIGLPRMIGRFPFAQLPDEDGFINALPDGDGILNALDDEDDSVNALDDEDGSINALDDEDGSINALE
ncbi:uncharacterized protein BKCO1_5300061 [Diplodia corticola]|uniref:Uncharacterized protein n=1 Tax=Diplodia corticola TaxID=236234 RepID=A0A1J9RT31_9PEZI|nr:uncharacterized protein BKCO1_5300061 [Diplodia corticola]OJD31028.1 hypothetical protein BKCO1_5300061 [Diplodia corticola]